MNNLHIVMNTFLHETRVLKETASLVGTGRFNRVFIVAIHQEGLEKSFDLDSNRTVNRFSLFKGEVVKVPRAFLLLLKYLQFFVMIIQYVKGKDISVVNVHQLALLPIGVALKLLFKIRLVYDAHELETETYGLEGFRKKLLKLIEGTLIHYVDLNIVVGNRINDWYRETYDIKNVVTAMNCPFYEGVHKSKKLHESLGIDERRDIVLYQGGLVGGRGIEGLLKAFSGLQDKKYVLVFMGYGELESKILQYQNQYQNIFLKSAVDSRELLQFTASAFVGVSYIDNPSLNDRYCLPNKLFEYVMARLPVMVNAAPEMRDFVSENDIGVVLSELTAESILSATKSIKTRDRGSLEEKLDEVALKCSWEKQSKEMLKGYEQYIFPGLEGTLKKEKEVPAKREA